MKKKMGFILLSGAMACSISACNNSGGENGNSVSTDTPQSVTQETDEGANSAPSAFASSMFAGDSFVEKIAKWVDKSQTIANAGATAQFAIEDVDQIAAKQPHHVFIMLGSNDRLMPVDDPIANSMNHYAKLIEEIRKSVPKVNIHVLSVTPVTDKVIKEEPRYKQIPDYNRSLKQMADNETVDYIDLSSIFQTGSDLHVEDGVHFKDEFYPLFLKKAESHLNMTSHE
ncbi:lysophospholipase L1-like esterase [Paenibacillus rhizosphaerae]|uniref:Lysophospholipase L1-like esterase n=1 Tax=Paenibacillus rhizosphaerae TaxID=297318 RepID=A0A839TK73_9BACL|nr:GDSL-type esterase/lipase family protein [Paenibacillus rhizosphaerae]MBB3126913.1 lysophospholipase L1-like esterase [Paenibacillus rhizosphaerae]